MPSVFRGGIISQKNATPPSALDIGGIVSISWRYFKQKAVEPLKIVWFIIL